MRRVKLEHLMFVANRDWLWQPNTINAILDRLRGKETIEFEEFITHIRVVYAPYNIGAREFAEDTFNSAEGLEAIDRMKEL